ncbi:MAG: DNA-binding protein Alba [Nitrososphaerales archaeon]|nr:DNA-binding protein Alba [Nitrososphaerales archaeon]
MYLRKVDEGFFNRAGGRMAATNVVLVGKKPVMNYVLACLTLFQDGSNEVIVKARGRAISKAVDVVQIVTKRFLTDVKVKKISIDTEQIKNEQTGTISNVSSMEIQLSK